LSQLDIIFGPVRYKLSPLDIFFGPVRYKLSPLDIMFGLSNQLEVSRASCFFVMFVIMKGLEVNVVSGDDFDEMGFETLIYSTNC
jgi:hypothetical protein